MFSEIATVFNFAPAENEYFGILTSGGKVFTCNSAEALKTEFKTTTPNFAE